MKDAVFKVCIFGDGGVGKTTLVNRYLTDLFKDDSSMTIGIDFHIKDLEIMSKLVSLQIWDFAGEERFRFLLPSYVRGASGGIFMYDVTRYSSLKNLGDWLTIFNGELKGDNRLPVLMVGGKADLYEKRSVPRETAISLAKSKQFSGFVECSAKSGQNVEKIFSTLTRLMLEKAGLL